MRALSLLVAALLAALPCPASQLIDSLNAGRFQTVVCYGTSETQYGAWVSQLSTKLASRYPGHVQVVNSGAAGQNSDYGYAHLHDAVLNYQPDTVLIEFSMNDAATMSVAQSAANLDAIIRVIGYEATKPTEIVLLIMNSVAGAGAAARPNLPAYNAAWREVAARYNLLLVDTYPTWSNMQGRARWQFAAWIPDGVHPNAAGSLAVTLPLIESTLSFKESP